MKILIIFFAAPFSHQPLGPGLLAKKASKAPSPPLFFTLQGLRSPTLPRKITQEPILDKLQIIEKSKMSQHHINDNINSFNSNVNNVWNNYTVVDEKSEILAWLSPLEPQKRHHDIQSRRIGKVGDWLLQTEEYRDWLGGVCGAKSDGSALFCYGGPGVGKTYIR